MLLKLSFLVLGSIFRETFSDTATNQPLICLGHCGQSCTTCSENYTYQCADGSCISLAKYRNHIIECPDGTDEAVSCCDGQFLCDTKHGIGKCLPVNKVDDGVQDCSDGTDETELNAETCRKFESFPHNKNTDSYYQCEPVPGGSKHGKCIDGHKVLDGNHDCPLKDDEDKSRHVYRRKRDHEDM